MEKVVS